MQEKALYDMLKFLRDNEFNETLREFLLCKEAERFIEKIVKLPSGEHAIIFMTFGVLVVPIPLERPVDDKAKDPLFEGYVAYHNNADFDDCPFRVGSNDYIHWAGGYQMAEDEVEEVNGGVI